MAVIRERISASGAKSYHVQVRIRGFPPQTKTFVSKTMAKQWAAMVETELKAGRYLPRVIAERHTVADLLDRRHHGSADPQHRHQNPDGQRQPCLQRFHALPSR